MQLSAFRNKLASLADLHGSPMTDEACPRCQHPGWVKEPQMIFLNTKLVVHIIYAPPPPHSPQATVNIIKQNYILLKYKNMY